MLKTNELISEIISLPIDIRAVLANKLLESLNPPVDNVDSLWAEISEKRIHEIESGKVTAIPGEEVFDKIRKRRS